MVYLFTWLKQASIQYRRRGRGKRQYCTHVQDAATGDKICRARGRHGTAGRGTRCDFFSCMAGASAVISTAAVSYTTTVHTFAWLHTPVTSIHLWRGGKSAISRACGRGRHRRKNPRARGRKTTAQEGTENGVDTRRAGAQTKRRNRISQSTAACT